MPVPVNPVIGLTVAAARLTLAYLAIKKGYDYVTKYAKKYNAY